MSSSWSVVSLYMFTNCVEREWRMVIRGIKIKKNKWEVQAPDAIRHFFASAHIVICRPAETVEG